MTATTCSPSVAGPAVRAGPAHCGVGRMVGGTVVFHLATRLLTLLALWAASARQGRGLSATLVRWDGRWYTRITEHGYPTALPTVDGRVVTNPAGFFPLFPLSLRPLVAAGLPVWFAAAVAAATFSAAAAVLIALLVRTWTNARVGLLAACCWSVFPTASVLSVAYAEGLFTLCAAGSLLLVVRRRWLGAGVAAALAGSARPTGVVVVAAVVVAAVSALLRERDQCRVPAPVAALVVAPLGTLGALGWIGWATSRPDAWAVTERQGWGVHFDGGVTFARWLLGALTRTSEPLQSVYAVSVLAAVALVVLAALRRPPLPVLVFLLLGTVLALGEGGRFYLSPMRFLLPVFPLLVPVAVWLARQRPAVSRSALGIAALVSAFVGVYYFTLSPGAP